VQRGTRAQRPVRIRLSEALPTPIGVECKFNVLKLEPGMLLALLLVLLLFFVGFGCGYGVREWIARRRRAVARMKFYKDNPDLRRLRGL
jgi:hypothetical protein